MQIEIPSSFHEFCHAYFIICVAVKSNVMFKRRSPKQRKAKTNKTLSGQVAYNEFGGYFIPNSSLHRPAVQQVLKGGVFERETIEFICQFGTEGDVIHAGTFFGDFYQQCLTQCQPGHRFGRLNLTQRVLNVPK